MNVRSRLATAPILADFGLRFRSGATRLHGSAFRNEALLSVVLLVAVLFLPGCSSTPPPAPVPAARLQAMRVAENAARLSQAENWTAAVLEWQTAADRFALLNDRANEAVAWHNLGQARRETGDHQAALVALERASAMNQALGLTNAWWRNQIALIQLEDAQGNTNGADARLKILLVRQAPEGLQGYFLNELGRHRSDAGDFSAAEPSLNQARRVFEQGKDQPGLGAVAVNRAVLLSREKQYSAAVDEWHRARSVYEALADARGITATLLGEGQTLLATGQDLPQAEELLRHAARNYATLRRPRDQQRALEGLIACLKAQSKPADPEKSRLDALRKTPPQPRAD